MALNTTTLAHCDAVWGRAATTPSDCVFNTIGVDVDTTVIKEKPEAILAAQPLSHCISKLGLGRVCDMASPVSPQDSETSGYVVIIVR